MKKLKTNPGKKVNLPNNPTNKDIKEALGQYCPFCEAVIYPSNVDELMSGLADGFVYIHKNVHHDEDYNFLEMH